MEQSLFDIGKKFYVLSDLANTISYDNETGEIINNDEVLQQLFDDIKGELGDKLDNTVYIVKELLAGAEALKAEKQRLEKRQKALENKAELLKKLALGALQASGKDKIKTLNHNFSIMKKNSVVCDDALLSRDYLRIKYEADKKKIADDLKKGVAIEGARLQENITLRVG